MIFNKHSDLEGQHAFLSASKYHWIDYDDDKLVNSYRTAMAAALGTRLHALAKEHIELGIKMSSSKKTLNMYINDAIGFRMRPEQVLFYSYNAFATTDAISFRKNVLRIHDLKTGVGRVSMKQLLIYAGLFCLEYEVKPAEIETILRIYQNDEIVEYQPDYDEVAHYMSRIVAADAKIQAIRAEENL